MTLCNPMDCSLPRFSVPETLWAGARPLGPLPRGGPHPAHAQILERGGRGWGALIPGVHGERRGQGRTPLASGVSCSPRSLKETWEWVRGPEPPSWAPEGPSAPTCSVSLQCCWACGERKGERGGFGVRLRQKSSQKAGILVWSSKGDRCWSTVYRCTWNRATWEILGRRGALP